MSMLKMIVSGAAVGVLAGLSVLARPMGSGGQEPAFRVRPEVVAIGDMRRAIRHRPDPCRTLAEPHTGVPTTAPLDRVQLRPIAGLTPREARCTGARDRIRATLSAGPDTPAPR